MRRGLEYVLLIGLVHFLALDSPDLSHDLFFMGQPFLYLLCWYCTCASSAMDGLSMLCGSFSIPKQNKLGLSHSLRGQVVSLERQQASLSATEADSLADADAGGDKAESAMAAPSRRTRQEWEWTVGSMQREHTHDVHALAIHEQTVEGRVEDGGVGVARKGAVLVSAGVDASLSLYSVPGFKTHVSTRFLW